MNTKQTEALKLAQEAGFWERCPSEGEYYEAGIENIVRLVELATEYALAEQPVPKTPLTVIVDELQESKNAIAACEALTPEQRHKINKPILEAQIFFRAAARMFSEKDALSEQPAQQQEPVAIPGPDAERIAVLLDKVVRQYAFKRGTEGYEALHLARRIACRYTIKGDPPLYTSPPASKPLTDAQIDSLRSGYQSGRIGSFVELCRAIEAAHGIK